MAAYIILTPWNYTILSGTHLNLDEVRQCRVNFLLKIISSALVGIEPRKKCGKIKSLPLRLHFSSNNHRNMSLLIFNFLFLDQVWHPDSKLCHSNRCHILHPVLMDRKYMMGAKIEIVYLMRQSVIKLNSGPVAPEN